MSSGTSPEVTNSPEAKQYLPIILALFGRHPNQPWPDTPTNLLCDSYQLARELEYLQILNFYTKEIGSRIFFELAYTGLPSIYSDTPANFLSVST